MLNARKLCASAEACLGWPYASPGTNDAKGIDCSGHNMLWVWESNGMTKRSSWCIMDPAHEKESQDGKW